MSDFPLRLVNGSHNVQSFSVEYHIDFQYFASFSNAISSVTIKMPSYFRLHTSFKIISSFPFFLQQVWTYFESHRTSEHVNCCVLCIRIDLHILWAWRIGEQCFQRIQCWALSMWLVFVFDWNATQSFGIHWKYSTASDYSGFCEYRLHAWGF